MALQRFTESYSTLGTRVKVEPLTQALQEKYNIDSATMFKLRENAGGSMDAPVRVYKFPISRFDHLNHNGRIYNGALWDNVIQNQQAEWKGRTGLADHPITDDGEFKNSAIVWHDMEKDDVNNLIWGTGIFVGDYGRLAQEIVDSGGRIGFSSSGYGELMMDGKTVNPDTFQLERCADIVLTPSQDVFGDSSNISASQTINYSSGPAQVAAPTHEPRPFVNSGFAGPYGEKTNYNRTNHIEETKVNAPDNKHVVSPMEEKKFRKDIQEFLESAEKLSSVDKLQELEEMLTFFDQGIALDLKETIQTKIVEEKRALEEAAIAGQQTLESFGVSTPEELKIGVALLAEECNVAVTEAKDWEKIALILREKNSELKEQMNALRESARKRSKRLQENQENKDAETNETIEDLEEELAKTKEALKEALESLRQSRANARQSIKEAEETAGQVDNIEAEKEELKERVLSLKKEVASYKVQLRDSANRESKAASALEKSKREIEEHKRVVERVSNNNAAQVDKQVKALKAQLVLKEKESARQVQSMKEQIQQVITQNNKLKAELQSSRQARKNLAENVRTKELKEQRQNRRRIDEQQRAALAANPIANQFKESEGVLVESYWADLVARHGVAIKPYEHQIRGCRTYREAGNAYMKIFPTLTESSTKTAAVIPESSAISKSERKQLLEESGMKFGSTETVVDRLPAGWM